MITARYIAAKNKLLLGVITGVFTVALILQTSAEATVDYSQTCSVEFGNHCLVNRPAPIATTVWGYSDRTMEHLSGLTAVLWQHLNTTLAGFDWYRSLSNTPLQVTQETQASLEDLVNTPIIQPAPQQEPIDLNSKIKRSVDMSNALYLHHQYVHSKIGLLSLKSDTLTATDITSGLGDVDKVLGEENDAPTAESLFGNIAWLRNNWQWEVLDAITTQAQAIKATIRAVQLSAAESNPTLSQELESLAGYSQTLDRLIGNSIQKDGIATLFGTVRLVQDTAVQLNAADEDISTLLTDWNETSAADISGQVSVLRQRVLALNQIPGASTLLEARQERADVSAENRIKNNVLRLKGLIQANAVLLSGNSRMPLVHTWLETGSVVFTTLVANPSSQHAEVLVKYYLPVELKQEDIVSTNEGITIAYDTGKNQLYAEGVVKLAPQQSHVVEIRTQDTWELLPETIASLRRQATELVRSLENTLFFTQGVALKSDIEALLDNALTISASTTTPEEKIHSFRRAHVEVHQAQATVGKLQQLVNQTRSGRQLLKLLGGPTTLAMWGLVAVVGAGFILLTRYVHLLTYNQLLVAPVSTSRRHAYLHVVSFLSFGFLTALISGITVGISMHRNGSSAAAYPDTSASEVATVGSEAMVLGVQEQNSVLDTTTADIEVLTIVAPSGTDVNVRQHPSTAAVIVQKIADGEPVVKLDNRGQWTHVAFITTANEIREGWVWQDYLIPLTSSKEVLSDNFINN